MLLLLLLSELLDFLDLFDEDDDDDDLAAGSDGVACGWKGYAPAAPFIAPHGKYGGILAADRGEGDGDD